MGPAVKELAGAFRKRLEPRLGAAVWRPISTSCVERRRGRRARGRGRGRRRSGQNEAARQGSQLVVAIRSAVRQGLPDDRAAQKGFGVGLPVKKGNVASVASALQIVLNAAAKDPARVRDAGVLPSDLDLAKQALSSLLSANAKQESRKVTAKQATDSRASAQLRVEAAIGKIMGAAAIELHDEPDAAARFEAIVPGRGRKVKPAPATP